MAIVALATVVACSLLKKTANIWELPREGQVRPLELGASGLLGVANLHVVSRDQ